MNDLGHSPKINMARRKEFIFLIIWVKLVINFQNIYFQCFEKSGNEKRKISYEVMEFPRQTQPVCITYSSISVYFQFLNIEMVVLKVLQEFARGTKIHGFKFLVSPKSWPRTKIIWAISIVVALTYATLEMRNSVVGKHSVLERI